MSVITGRRKPGDRWLPSDTVCALAWQGYVDSLCTGCGHPRHESMARENTGAYRASALRCHSCDGIAQEVERRREAPWPQALYFTAERRPPTSQTAT